MTGLFGFPDSPERKKKKPFLASLHSATVIVYNSAVVHSLCAEKTV